MKYIILLVAMLIVITGIFSCRDDVEPLPSQNARKFIAEGNIDPESWAPAGNMGEVVVKFYKLPARFSFNLPAFPCMVTEYGILYYNGWCETYERELEDIFFGPEQDFFKAYKRMWIESHKDARIVLH
jgi:hypothetical protein